jgi:tRNA A37 threonylcarbamoyladenosine synthetase subunit TsaC/SUA5/YrdC
MLRGWGVHGWDLVRAARALASGGVIAYPTEAVFGLGCDPWNETALLGLVRLKRRPQSKGFIVIAGAHEDLSGLVTFPDAEVRGRVLATWPGPVTWVLPACPGVSRRLTGGRRRALTDRYDSLKIICFPWEGYPSGQREQTVNLPAQPS